MGPYAWALLWDPVVASCVVISIVSLLRKLVSDSKLRITTAKIKSEIKSTNNSAVCPNLVYMTSLFQGIASPWVIGSCLLVIVFRISSYSWAFSLRSDSYFIHEGQALVSIFSYVVLTSIGALFVHNARRAALSMLFLLTLCLSLVYIFILRPTGSILRLRFTPSIAPEVRNGETPRMVILGAYCDLPPENLDTYARSLRQTGSQAEVYIFCDEGDLQYGAEVDKYALHIVSYDWVRPLHPAMFQFSSLRMNLYREFLQRLEEQTSEVPIHFVMISDVKDVFFQRDPLDLFLEEPRSGGPQFHYPAHQDLVDGWEEGGKLSSDLEKSLEQRFVEDGEELLVVAGEVTPLQLPGINGEWVAQCAGNGVLSSHSSPPPLVSCSGTTLGSLEVMKKYLLAHVSVSGIDPFCASHGVDQGVHNYLLLRPSFVSPQVRREDALCGRILTVDKVQGVRVGHEGSSLVNCFGEEYVIVHQWNRCNARTLAEGVGKRDSPKCEDFPKMNLWASNLSEYAATGRRYKR